MIDDDVMQDQDNRPAVYIEGDRVIYRASGLGYCMKGLVAARKQMTPLPHSDEVLRWMGEGNIHEDPILMEVEKQGYTVSDQQREVEFEVAPGIVVRGHIDGKAAEVTTDEYVVDAKAVSKDRYALFERTGLSGFVPWKWQLSVYMLALDLPGMMAVKDRNSGKVLIRTYHDPPFSSGAIKKRVMMVEAAARRPIAQTPCEPNAMTWNCVWRYLHDDTTTRADSPDPDLLIILGSLCSSYDSERAKEKRAKDAKDALGGRIVQVMMQSGVGQKESVDSGEFLASYSYRHKPRRLDEGLIAQRLGEPDLTRYEIRELSDNPSPTITRKKR